MADRTREPIIQRKILAMTEHEEFICQNYPTYHPLFLVVSGYMMVVSGIGVAMYCWSGWDGVANYAIGWVSTTLIMAVFALARRK